MKRRRFALAAVVGFTMASCGGAGDIAPAGETTPPVQTARAVRRVANEVVDPTLDWLMTAQRPDGSWSADDAPPGSVADDVSATSLALLAYLSEAYTNRSEGKFGPVVGNGLRWLRGRQDEDGRFLPRDRPGSLRHDALAATAFAEAFGMTGSEIFRVPARKAVDALVASNAATPPAGAAAQDPAALDTFGRAVIALLTARVIDRSDTKRGREVTFHVDERALEPARAWLEASDREGGRDPSLVATRIVVRVATGYGRADLEALQRDIYILSEVPVPVSAAEDLPGRVAVIAEVGSHVARSACFEAWGKRGEAWQRAATRRDADAGGLLGSYDERGPLATRTGRVEATAIGKMAERPCCTCYFGRFPGTEPPPEPDEPVTPPADVGDAEPDANR